VVFQKKRRVFNKKQITENEYIDAYFLEHYKIQVTVEKVEIVQRLK
jgi:hypothetical protein